MTSAVLISPPMDGSAGRRLGVRHLQASLMALTSLVAYSLRANLSVAVVAMVRTPSNSSGETAAGEDGADMDEFGVGGARVFAWEEWQRGWLLSAFFWGYTLSQIPGGTLSHRLGGARLLKFVITSTSIATLAFPLCAEYGGWMAVFANRVVQGVTQGPLYPSMYTLLGVWVPPQERESFTTLIMAMQLLGPTLASPVCGFMAARWGWPSIFYAFGSAGLVVGGLLIWLASDKPALDPRISSEELAYIETCLKTSEESSKKVAPRTPWLSVLTSPCMWVLWINMSVQAMSFFILLTTIPTYLSSVLGFSIQENGLLTSLPYLMGFLASYVFMGLANFINSRKLLSTTNSRKFFNAIAGIPISLCVVATGYVSTATMSVVLICLSMSFFGSTIVGVQANYLDIAPLYCGPIYSVGNMMAALLGVAAPIVVGSIVTDPVRTRGNIL
ncbi:Sialin [Frankliniella fusca]|uniref:Sialin n=1 Tax=Frankliniella fusca TaxID=407009 RepID=A0AAE1H7D9_9NEOP|nr:Sialin [Frankliniella fusca]